MKKGEAGLSADSDVMMDQMRAIDNSRIRRELGAAPRRCLDEIQQRAAILLDLPGA
jgi:mRNA-degrading endonuclease toxin of MazEF toxin-antitoxin module